MCTCTYIVFSTQIHTILVAKEGRLIPIALAREAHPTEVRVTDVWVTLEAVGDAGLGVRHLVRPLTLGSTVVGLTSHTGALAGVTGEVLFRYL